MPMNENDADPVKPAAEPIGAAQPEEPSGRSEREPPARSWRMPVTLVLLAAIVVVCWQWYDTRSQIDVIRVELGRRLRASDTAGAESAVLAKQAFEGTREAQVKLSVLENKVAESQSQQAALLALRTAEGRLARSQRPQFIPLRRVLNRDIERLKAAPNLDITGMALRLDRLIAGVDTLPLHFDERTQAAPKAAVPAGASGVWERMLVEVMNEMKQLVRIRVMDQPDAALLSPTQSFFLRQNLQLRLLDARMALLARDPARFRADLETARAWMTRYYDTRATTAAAAMASLKELEATGIDIELPTIADSLAAVRNFKVPGAKGV